MSAPGQVTQGRLVERRVSSKPQGTALRGFGTTMRVDRWSLRPLAIALGLTAFIVYATISAVLLIPYFGFPYEAEGYHSPFYSHRPRRRHPARLALAGHPGPLGPGLLPGHLLLLPRRLLQGLLRRPAGLRRGRALHPSPLRHGEPLPLHPHECPPLLPVPRLHPARRDVARPRPGLLARRPRAPGDRGRCSSPQTPS